jgi:pilus assembly protein TadC
VAGLAGPAGALLLGLTVAPGIWWLVVPGCLGTAVVLVVRGRREARGSPRDRAARRIWLIGHDELLAACLESGLAPAAALRAVNEALAELSPPARGGGADPTTVLESVAAMLSLGADADTAWRVADTDDDLAALAAAARRSAAGGTTLADAVREHASLLRDQSRQDAARSAGRAGVLMTAPLGVCFLPAFLCLGLAPVVLGLLGHLTIR